MLANLIDLGYNNIGINDKITSDYLIYVYKQSNFDEI